MAKATLDLRNASDIDSDKHGDREVKIANAREAVERTEDAEESLRYANRGQDASRHRDRQDAFEPDAVVNRGRPKITPPTHPLIPSHFGCAHPTPHICAHHHIQPYSPTHTNRSWLVVQQPLYQAQSFGRTFRSMNRFKDTGHLLRFAALFVIAFVVFLVIRHFVVPKSFGEYGHYRGAAIAEIAARPVHFAGTPKPAKPATPTSSPPSPRASTPTSTAKPATVRWRTRERDDGRRSTAIHPAQARHRRSLHPLPRSQCRQAQGLPPSRRRPARRRRSLRNLPSAAQPRHPDRRDAK